MDEKKRAMVYIATPKHLRDFLWFYTASGENISYDCICAGSDPGQSLPAACGRAGIFDHIKVVPNLLTSSPLALLRLTARLFFAHFTGRKEDLAENLLYEYSGYPPADRYICSCNWGLLPGLMVMLSGRYEVVQLEDGLGDYLDRSGGFRLSYLANPKMLYYYFLAKMGYTDCTMIMGTKGDAGCVKYVSFPTLMNYRKFKRIEKLYDFGKTDRSAYLSLAEKTFMTGQLPSDATLIIFTAPLSDYELDVEKYTDLMCRYISEHFAGAKAILKKHPRDDQKNYDLPGIEVISAAREIPGELLIQNLTGVPVVAFNMSTILLAAADQGGAITVFRIHETDINAALRNRYTNTFEKGLNMLERLGKGHTKVIDI